MADLTEAMKHKVAVLDALDRDGRERGQYDLHDQITTLCDLQTKTEKVLSRSREIVGKVVDDMEHVAEGKIWK